ncbi:MAG: DUF2946 domain-containing protein [Deltaproteobacteria bacterium]|jgi:hypothetical protein|nr:DUF2946 domain-containing protein [Deltaproteobacteria bacterium]MBW2503112.1 DUF2946 domain-containing protein [Deltaproteobacteria bacterium]
MKKTTITLLALMFIMTIPMALMASSHEAHEMKEHGSEHAEHMEHKEGTAHDEHMEHKAHDMHMEHAKEKSHAMHGGDFATIGEETVDNVKAVAKVMTYDAEKAAMVNATHHVMVEFTDLESNEKITDGKVAIKIATGDITSKPMMLMQMGDGFGTDLRLDKGHYDFEVGTKLKDDKKRQFNYSFMSQ